MIISDIEIRACRNAAAARESSEMRYGGNSDYDYLVVTMTTEDGVTGTSLGFAARGAASAASIAASSLKPFFLGRDALARERHWQDFRSHDRWWHHTPIYSYGPFDICLWDIAGKVAGLPLYKLLGGYRDRVPAYVSSMALETPEDYAAQALEVKERGFHGYKLHPHGSYESDLAAYRACREAVGPDFPLMADPVAAYSYEEALRMGRELERLDYLWFEEPVYDVDFRSLRRLTEKLDIPIVGTEVLHGGPYAVAECIIGGVVDAVRACVSWKGGVTGVMKTATMADLCGMSCEIHTAIYHALDTVNLHCCAAISNSRYFELLYPLDDMDIAMKTPLAIDDEGYAHPPQTPGTGIDWDWAAIEADTLQVL